MTANHIKRRLLLIFFATSLLGACANMLGPREIEVPLAKLQQHVDKKFPINHRYLELFNIALGSPKLALMPDSQRIGMTIDAAISPPLAKRSWKGTLSLSASLKIDLGNNALHLTEMKIENFAIDGGDTAYQRQLMKIANLIGDKLIRDVPIYTFKAEDLRVAGTNFAPTRITTKSSGIVILFEPVR